MAQRDPSQTSRRMEKAMSEMPMEAETFLAIVLNHAGEAEANFLALYDVAIRKVDDEAAKEKLREFRGDHESHAREIRGLLDQMDAPIYAEERPTPVARGLIQRLDAATSDEQRLMDFLATEDFSRRFYEWVGMVGAPEPVARVAQRALGDEERHYQWAAQRLGIE